jgi:hypothetical protein
MAMHAKPLAMSMAGVREVEVGMLSLWLGPWKEISPQEHGLTWGKPCIFSC